MRSKAPLSIIIALAVCIAAVLAFTRYSLSQESKGAGTSPQVAGTAVSRPLPHSDKPLADDPTWRRNQANQLPGWHPGAARAKDYLKHHHQPASSARQSRSR